MQRDDDVTTELPAHELSRRLFLGATAGVVGATAWTVGNPLPVGAASALRGATLAGMGSAIVPQPPPTDPVLALEIATQVYQYLTAIVLMDITRLQSTNVPPSPRPVSGTKAQMNVFAHARSYPAADNHEIVRINFDTLYSFAWLDLTQGGVIVSNRGTDGTFWLFQTMDMWTDTFAAPGTRTTGDGPQRYAIVPPGFTGTIRPSLVRIDSPTPYVWIAGRTQTNGEEDYPKVNAIQNGYTISLLDGSTPPSYPVDPNIDMVTPPFIQWSALSGRELFEYGAQLMLLQPVHITDFSIVNVMSSLGVIPGQPFDYDAQSSLVQDAIDAAPASSAADLNVLFPNISFNRNGWQTLLTGTGTYGNSYNVRALQAILGLGGNEPVDAIYPVLVSDADGQPLVGEETYVLHFDADDLPPVNAFWSVTMYDADGFQVANPINRFKIGSLTPGLQFNADGSLDVYIQHDSPGPALESNWLPSPLGLNSALLRLYWPKPSALNGGWIPPAVVKTS